MVSSTLDGKDELLRSQSWLCYRKMGCRRSGGRCLHRISITQRVRPLPLKDQSGRYHQKVGARAEVYVLATDALNTTRFEIVATLVTFEQENLTSPIKSSFRTIQKVQVEKEVGLSDSFSGSPMVLWRDYWIGAFVRVRPTIRGLFLWNMRNNTICYFEVCHSLSVSGCLESQFATDGVRPALSQSH